MVLLPHPKILTYFHTLFDSAQLFPAASRIHRQNYYIFGDHCHKPSTKYYNSAVDSESVHPKKDNCIMDWKIWTPNFEFIDRHCMMESYEKNIILG